MSGVATLKPRKRHFDEMNVDLPGPSQSCSPARFVVRPPPLKRGRCNPSAAAPALVLPAVRPSSTSSSQAKPPSPASSPPPSTPRLSADELAALSRHVPRRLKRVVDRMGSGQVGVADKVFTVEDLRDIITSVLAEREAKLNEEFTATLNDRLREQFRDFTTFNEDYVSRQMRGRDFTYLS